jgi:hypothetical protein
MFLPHGAEFFMKNDHSDNVLWAIINVLSENHTEPMGILWKKCIPVNGNTDGRLRLKCEGTHAETTSGLSAKWTSPFKLAGVSVQLTTSSRGVGISGSNAGYTVFQGSVRVLATHSIRQFPLHFPFCVSPCAIRFQLDSTYCYQYVL